MKGKVSHAGWRTGMNLEAWEQVESFDKVQVSGDGYMNHDYDREEGEK